MDTLWSVQPIRKHSEGKDYTAFRVQRACQIGQLGGIEMAFAHESKELCERIAKVLNDWIIDPPASL